MDKLYWRIKNLQDYDDLDIKRGRKYIKKQKKIYLISSSPASCCHDITLSRGCLIAGLPLVCTERVEHYYKSMGWSLFHENIAINTINNPHAHVLRL